MRREGPMCDEMANTFDNRPDVLIRRILVEPPQSFLQGPAQLLLFKYKDHERLISSQGRCGSNSKYLR